MSSGDTHPDFATLSQLRDGSLADDDRSRCAAHLAGCAACAARMEWLMRTVDLLRSSELEDAPAALIARAVRLFSPLAAPRPLGVRRRLVALLRSGGAPSPAFGLRGGVSDVRRCFYEAGAFGIDLRLAPHAVAGWDVTGQLLGPTAGGVIHLESGDLRLAAPVSEDGEFRLDGVAPGRYALRCESGDDEIHVEAFDVGG